MNFSNALTMHASKAADLARLAVVDQEEGVSEEGEEEAAVAR